MALTGAKKHLTTFGKASRFMLGDRDGSWTSWPVHTKEINCLLQKEQNSWVPRNDIVREERAIDVAKPRTNRQTAAIAPSPWISPGEDDRKEFLALVRRAAKNLAGCMVFRNILLPCVCKLDAHRHRYRERPESHSHWDQKSWSHQYSCVTYGFSDDPGNSSYSVAFHLLLIELSPIGTDLKRLQDLYERYRSIGMTDGLRNAMGDVLEAVGGICDDSYLASRELQHQLTAAYGLGSNAFLDVGAKLKDLANLSYFLESSYSSCAALLLEDVYRGREVIVTGDECSPTDTATSQVQNEKLAEACPQNMTCATTATEQIRKALPEPAMHVSDAPHTSFNFDTKRQDDIDVKFGERRSVGIGGGQFTAESTCSRLTSDPVRAPPLPPPPGLW